MEKKTMVYFIVSLIIIILSVTMNYYNKTIDSFVTATHTASHNSDSGGGGGGGGSCIIS
jgi:hypothetical protein